MRSGLRPNTRHRSHSRTPAPPRRRLQRRSPVRLRHPRMKLPVPLPIRLLRWLLTWTLSQACISRRLSRDVLAISLAICLPFAVSRRPYRGAGCRPTIPKEDTRSTFCFAHAPDSTSCMTYRHRREHSERNDGATCVDAHGRHFQHRR